MPVQFRLVLLTPGLATIWWHEQRMVAGRDMNTTIQSVCTEHRIAVQSAVLYKTVVAVSRQSKNQTPCRKVRTLLYRMFVKGMFFGGFLHSRVFPPSFMSYSTVHGARFFSQSFAQRVGWGIDKYSDTTNHSQFFQDRQSFLVPPPQKNRVST